MKICRFNQCIMLDTPAGALNVESTDITTLLRVSSSTSISIWEWNSRRRCETKQREKKRRRKIRKWKNYPYQNDVDNSIGYIIRVFVNICTHIHLNYWCVPINSMLKHTDSGCSSTSFASKYVVTDVKIVVFSMGQIFLRQSICIIIQLVGCSKVECGGGGCGSLHISQ